ncbi:MAG: ankyrin repeat domain-containing protein [Thermoanaerobaculia bacterium]|nr:ankyrin repeat domain-containing protein [Thermoanaerobaculia bacterium]
MTTTTELFTAIAAGDEAAVSALLAADPGLAEATNDQGLSVLVFALYHRRRDFAEGLATARRTPLTLPEAAALGRLERVREILTQNPGGIEERSADGFTALHYGAFFDHPELVAVLLEHGADVASEAANPSRVQPLHSAIAARGFEVSRLLLAHGADPNARQQGGFTPLQGAAGGDRRDLVELLLAHGARRDDRADDGRTAADVARDKGHAEMAAFLAAGSG